MVRGLFLINTRAYVNRRGPREYGCNSFITVPHGSKPVSSGKGIAIAIIIMQAVIAAVLW